MLTRTSACAAVALLAPVASASLANTLFAVDRLNDRIMYITDAPTATGTVTPTRSIDLGFDLGGIADLAFDGRELFLGSNYTLRVYNVQSGDLVRTISVVPRLRGLTAGYTDADGEVLFAWDSGLLHVLDSQSGQTIRVFNLMTQGVDGGNNVGAAFDLATGNVVVSGLSGQGFVATIDPNTGQVLSNVSALNRDYNGGLAYVGGQLFGSQVNQTTDSEVYHVNPADGSTSVAFSIEDAVIVGLAGIPAPSSVAAVAGGLLLATRRRR